jgi:hypothetical protein
MDANVLRIPASMGAERIVFDSVDGAILNVLVGSHLENAHDGDRFTEINSTYIKNFDMFSTYYKQLGTREAFVDKIVNMLPDHLKLENFKSDGFNIDEIQGSFYCIFTGDRYWLQIKTVHDYGQAGKNQVYFLKALAKPRKSSGLLCCAWFC